MSDVFVHPQALCESPHVGAGTRIWAFAHVLPGARVGRDCNVCDHTFVENDVVIGDRVTIKCGVQVWDGVRIEDDAFLGPNVTLTNDKRPRSRDWQARPVTTLIRRGASIGANATILPGLTIGENAMVGAGAVVTRDVPPNAIVMGNPARITGYVGADVVAPPPAPAPSAPGITASRVRGVRLVRLPLFRDLRGSLSVGEFEKDVPFAPARYFLVFGVPGKDVRGEHAHRECAQFMVCVRGEVTVMADDGVEREQWVLDRPDLAVHVPPRVWATQYRYSDDAVLLVFASHPYDPADYVRDYAEFRALVQGTRA